MSQAIKTISAADFLGQSQTGKTPLVIDVRTRAEVTSESFEGCMNMPLHKLKAEQVNAYLQQNAQQNEPVYLLCGSGKRAIAAAEKLAHELSHPVWVIEGGIQALKQAGCVLKQGKSKVISLERQVRIAAGSLVLLGVLLGFFVAPGFYGLSAFVGAGLIFAGVSDTCMMGMLLARMPWNSAS